MFVYKFRMLKPEGVTPKRRAAAKAKFTRKYNETMRKNEQVALLPELQVELPEPVTPEAEIAAHDERTMAMQESNRIEQAKEWRKARARVFALDSAMRARVLKHWNRGIYPGTPGYLVTVMHGIVTGKFDPEGYDAMLQIAKRKGEEARAKIDLRLARHWTAYYESEPGTMVRPDRALVRYAEK